MSPVEQACAGRQPRRFVASWEIMFRSLRFLVALCLLPAAGLPADPLATLRKTHPRLIALDSDLARMRELVKSHPLAKRIHAGLAGEAARLESADTVKYEIVGPRLLAQSRRCLDRIYTLALLYRLDGGKQYLDRALKELRAAAAFPNWNPSHFLDTAEMTHAFAIGYDWLYPALSPDDRAWIRHAILEKGLKPALEVYARPKGWHKANHNWNQVCNGGIGIGALAVAEDERETAARVLTNALASLPLAMASYAPEGGWAEGPGYWHYATRYNVYLLAALESALGTDFNLSASPGFHRAGHFRLYFSGPSGKTFNYADAGDSVGPAAEMFWLARKFSQPAYSWQQQKLLDAAGRGDALDLVWFQPQARPPEPAAWPLDAAFQGVEAAFLRSDWQDPAAVFAAVKGGDNKANHSHLDLGSFVLDALGTRWALDFGGDDYNLPAYFGALRWTYYRLRTESHNTVLIDNQNQDPAAAAPILETSFKPGYSSVRIDLSRAYPGKLARHERTLALAERRRVLVQDSIQANQPVEALWGMVTDADVALNGRTAELRKKEGSLAAEIQSPAGARFDIVSTTPPPPQRPNEGTRKLVVRLPGRVSEVNLIVALTPRASR